MSDLASVLAIYRRWLHFPDPTPLIVALATVIANLMEEGDPVWLVIVGGSSRGKTEVVIGVSGLEYVRPFGSASEAGLLSGTPRKDRAKNATGGVLREIPERGGILLVKDFGAILSMPRDRRASVLQALREVYDGSYTRDVGTGGGERLQWAGRVGLIAGATGDIDRHHAVISALGERWLTLRLEDETGRDGARAAMRREQTEQMRAELRDAVREFLETITPPTFTPIADDELEFLAALAELIATARSSVIRDAYSREIELVPQAEGPARVARQLHKLSLCLGTIGVAAAEVRAIVHRVGVDCIPSPRREVLAIALEHAGEEFVTTEVATRLDLPHNTATRTLEDLNAHGLLKRRKESDAKNAPNIWRASELALEIIGEVEKGLNQAETHSPVMSGVPSLSERGESKRDITGEQSANGHGLPDAARRLIGEAMDNGQTAAQIANAHGLALALVEAAVEQMTEPPEPDDEEPA